MRLQLSILPEEEKVRKLIDYILLNAYSVNSTGLHNGKAGIALALFEAAKYFQDTYIEEQAIELLQESLLSENKNIDFEEGLSGIGYVLLYLIKNKIQLLLDRDLMMYRKEENEYYAKVTLPLPQNYREIMAERFWMQKYNEHVFRIIKDIFPENGNSLSIIHSYDDERIKLIHNRHDFIASLNTGLNAATSKYIARMDADDRMNIDRLKIQYSRLEEFSQITVCSSWMTSFGEYIPPGMLVRSASGLVEHPLLHLLEYNKEYIYAEDYKLWFEVARHGGLFYVETQPLLYYRISDSQVSKKKQEEQQKVSIRIKKEILDYLKWSYPYIT